MKEFSVCNTSSSKTLRTSSVLLVLSVLETEVVNPTLSVRFQGRSTVHIRTEDVLYARVDFGHLVRRHLYLGDLGYHSSPHVVDAQGCVSCD